MQFEPVTAAVFGVTPPAGAPAFTASLVVDAPWASYRRAGRMIGSN